jgi:hypothetical protein
MLLSFAYLAFSAVLRLLVSVWGRRVRKLVRGSPVCGSLGSMFLRWSRGGLFALVVRVSRCPEPVRAGMAAGAAASLEGAGDPRPAARAGDPPPAGVAAEADAG